ncbi:hypothetical protein F503_02711 [Ophiostoma piceae UAMH 11346]|uniref:Uncharacterized protein n=1 Tax=Ophiostoma piceae (strain UAMH 11346) TaxID=1262450 RepID=S3CJG9_OPHP1|nr:hypothetical protein F503_02711 [Ophiostoma piceae UAMH 11346]
MSSAFSSKTDVDIKVEHTEYAGGWQKHDEKPKKPERSTVAAREDRECRVVTALRNWLSRPRINKANVRDTTGGMLIATEPSLELCLHDFFTSSRRRFQLSLKDRLLCDSMVCAEMSCPPRRFTPRAKATFAFEQLHLDGNPVDKVLRFDFNMSIKHPYILDKSVIISVVPSQPGDFTIDIKFLDHSVPGDADQDVPVLHMDKVKQCTLYDGEVGIVSNTESGIALYFCRGCEAFDAHVPYSDDEAEEYDTGLYTPSKPTPKDYSRMSPERLEWELIQDDFVVYTPSRFEGHRHRAPIAQCAIKVLYKNGRYWPRLQTLPN